MKTLPRPELAARMRSLLRVSPVVALLGPRQSGKTTLARQILEAYRRGEHFDLEDPRDAQRLAHPMTALERLRGLVVIDEVQRAPELFTVLRVLADRRPLPARFLVLGSASPELLRQSSETLAGRIRFMELPGFSLAEVGVDHLRRRLLRGGFPRSYLAPNDLASFGWREDFIRTFIERDLPSLGERVQSPVNLRRLWTMLAHRHAQLWNGAALATSLGESYPTVKRHLDLLTGALVVRQLPPWLPNLEKRMVKSPKVYLRDSGLAHALLGIRQFRELEGHPVLGASWEGLVLEELLGHVSDRDLYFWSTHAGAEVDFVWRRGDRVIGFEAKWGDAPAMTRSIHIALADLGLAALYVVYPGPHRYRLDRRVEVIPIGELPAVLPAR
ncbi:MAG TPA: ATP-binding protein [Kofleriaceae bacterium]|nr:ATP-binding protein [Kofleriaceae bacterium]